ncbi:MAG: DUF3137 domain-containing protein [Aquificaceae bacterium]|nr:DUF3137 domain-containing protein [Aquificaceae bacterium]MDW8236955.1 DUF3137 domain-containing protein [Aquificaceae bacterium]
MQEIDALVSSLEEQRQKLIKSTIRWFFIYASLGLFLFFLGMFYPSYSYLILFGIGIFLIGTILSIVNNHKKFKKAFKESFLKELFRLKFGENFEYRPNDYIREELFVSSRLFSHKPSPDRYSGEDLILTSVDSIKLSFSEVKAEYKETYFDSNGRKRERWVDIFRGVFVIADFPKMARVPVVVLPNFEKVVSLPWEELKKVKLEDPEFEKFFDVWSKDQVEARYILSISLMQRMVEFYKKAKEKGFRPEIYFSFIGRRMFCALKSRSSGDFLKVPFYLLTSKKSLMSGSYELYIQEVELILSIVNELNLNLDIWL